MWIEGVVSWSPASRYSLPSCHSNRAIPTGPLTFQAVERYFHGQGAGHVSHPLNTEFQERNAEISPDGRYIAYESNESGEFEIYVRPFPDVNAGRWQVSSGGGRWPFWAPDGRELFYLSGQTEIVAVATSTEPTFTLGRRETLFDMGPYAGTANLSRRIDISPDGERFLLLKTAATQEDIVVVQNWFQELKRLVPTE